MSKISESIASQGQDVAKMEKFIEKFGDEATYDMWGFFDTYFRSTFLHIELCGEFIVYVNENAEHERGHRPSGIGHKRSMHACNLEMTKVWDLGYLLSYRDQYDQSKDRQGPHPKKIVKCAQSADDKLSVTALMPDGKERDFTLSLRPPKS